MPRRVGPAYYGRPLGTRCRPHNPFAARPFDPSVLRYFLHFVRDGDQMRWVQNKLMLVTVPDGPGRAGGSAK